MAAVPASTAVSELFGHARGAFTGAAEKHAGWFDRADGGTLFLDEIGETSPDVQAMLLRVLETGEIQPVGASRTRRVDVRVIAATDRDLEAAAESSEFRLPLLHRLAGYEIRVPPLRDRRDDIARLFAHFLRAELEALGDTDRLAPPERGAPLWIPTALVRRLVLHDWPGNVRELRNTVRQLLIKNRGADEVRLPRSIEDALTVVDAPSAEPPSALTAEQVEAALERNRWEIKAAAADLGVARGTLYKLIKRIGVMRTASEIDEAELRAEWAASNGDVDATVARLKVSRRALEMRLRAVGIAS